MQMVPDAGGKRWSLSNVGSKANTLRQLANNGLSVPNTWVLPSTHFTSEYRRSSESRASITAHSDAFWNSLRHEVEALLENESSLAIRSSASVEDGSSHSFAGIFLSFLNVKYADEALNAVQACWSSVDSPANSAYCRRIGMDPQQIEMAVILQTMIASVVSGVTLSRDPISGDDSRFIVEVSRNARAVVDGVGHMAYYEISATSGDVLMTRQSDTAPLAAADIVWIWQVTRAISAQLGSGFEIEWAIDQDSRRYIVQARPFTAKRRMD